MSGHAPPLGAQSHFMAEHAIPNAAHSLRSEHRGLASGGMTSTRLKSWGYGACPSGRPKNASRPAREGKRPWPALFQAKKSPLCSGLSISAFPPEFWLREKDLNLRPLGYEPNELPDCSIARQEIDYTRRLEAPKEDFRQKKAHCAVGFQSQRFRLNFGCARRI
jgi:hypothetical protein